MNNRALSVLLVASSAPQAAGDATAPFILNMAEDLQTLGLKVTILAPHAAGCATEEVLSGVRIIRYRYAWPARLQTLCAGGSAMVRLRKNPLNALQIPLLVAAQCVAIARLSRRQHYDCLFSHWLLPQGFVCGLMARLLRMKHVTMVHGADLFSLNAAPLRWAKRMALRRADAVIANSSFTAAQLRLLDNRTDVAIIPTGATPLPEGFISPLQRADVVPEGTKLIVFLGRIVEEKGLRIAIEALAALKTPARLLVLGAGSDRAACEALAERLGVQEKLQFLGAVAPARIYDYLTLADAFVAPSLSMPDGWVEAQGNSIVEALFAGIPVVASRCGGIPDAIIDGETGLLVPERDVAALAAALERLFADDTLAERLTQHGRAHAHAGFSRLSCARKIALLLQNASMSA